MVNKKPAVRLRADRPRAHAIPQPKGLRMVDGRLVGPTLNDPEVKKQFAETRDQLRKDPEKLRAWYVKRGVLTAAGKLTKNYGG